MRQTVNIPIQLFCVISTLGDLTPVRFRYENEEHEILTVNIDQVLNYKETMLSGVHEIVYTCTAQIDTMERMFNLKYNVNHHRWSFFEILA